MFSWDSRFSYQGVVGRTVHKIQDGSDLIFLEGMYMQQQGSLLLDDDDGQQQQLTADEESTACAVESPTATCAPMVQRTRYLQSIAVLWLLDCIDWLRLAPILVTKPTAGIIDLLISPVYARSLAGIW
eukprot:scaffold3990_cov284-Chaetoceros_neogracile.AAC.18